MSPAYFCNLMRYFCWFFYWEEYKWSGFSSFHFIFLFYLKRSFLSSFFINKLGTILGLSFWGLLSRTFPSRLLNRACVRNFKLGVLPLHEIVNSVGAAWPRMNIYVVPYFCGCCSPYVLWHTTYRKNNNLEKCAGIIGLIGFISKTIIKNYYI